MAKNQYQLPEESLASLNEFGDRKFIHPMEVHGVYKRYKNFVHAILLLLFLIVPWIKINGTQAILLNIPERKFALFGLTFFAHDGPLIFFVLATLVLSLSFVTAIWGRVWCGWACPQTVFIEGVFRRIEKWIEGNHIKRRQLDREPLNGKKILKRLTKWFAFTTFSLLITHSFLAYFIGAERVIEIIQLSPKENWTSFLVILFTTGLILFDFGWFREQFCIIACPYGRFQSVLMDPHTTNVIYDSSRGEPRKGTNGEQPQGDCINCYKCVAVCPTGVDIRRGTQMECIACTACIDACDEVMEKIKKPKGLIRYMREVELLKGENKKRPKTRVLIYLSLIFVSIFGLVYNVSQREDLHITILRAQDSPYKEISENSQMKLINHIKVHLKNQRFEKMLIKLIDHSNPTIELVSPKKEFVLNGGQTQRHHVFIKFPKELTLKTGESKVILSFEYTHKGKKFFAKKDFNLVGPQIN